MKTLLMRISVAAMLCLAVPFPGKANTVARDWPINMDQVVALDVTVVRNGTATG